MRARAGLAAVAAAIFVAGCGGGSSTTVSADSLKPRLLASIPGLQVQRSFDWKDPIDFMGEGLFLPQAARPSDAVKLLRDNGYRGGAGTGFAPASQPDNVSVEGVAQFGSAKEAEKVRDWIHARDLTPPCFEQCNLTPRALAIPGVPTVRAVAQAQKGPPPGVPVVLPPTLPGGRKPKIAAGPTTYLAEFTVGPYLYYARAQGLTQEGLPQRFVAGVKAAYQHAQSFK